MRAKLLVSGILSIFLSTCAMAQVKAKILHRFGGYPNDGSFPYAGLTLDKNGNLFGTTEVGGSEQCSYYLESGCGTVLEMSPDGKGGWNETVLHNFEPASTDGTIPTGNLIFDNAGNIYGTTQFGGSAGEGTVFELSPDGKGGWNESILYAFQAGPQGNNDGANPAAGLTFDAKGNLYGTTISYQIECGTGCGTVFMLSPSGNGSWNETILHIFCSGGVIGCTDGISPYGGVILDSSGNVYGTTSEGGTDSLGTVFELSPNGSGGWNETILFSFYNAESQNPEAGMIFDASGNLYGTTNSSVFELSPNGSGGWNEQNLHSFPSENGDGALVYAGVIFDGKGGLYGTTAGGGGYPNEYCIDECGTVFHLTPSGNGSWNETKVSFADGAAAANPYGALVMDSLGNLYGTAYDDNNRPCYGRKQNRACGSVFEIQP